MIDKIYDKDNNTELALIIRSNFKAEGIKFFTPDEYSQQIGYMNRPKGYIIPPHIHIPVTREVHFTKEVLFVKSGRLRVDFYKESKEYIQSTILEAGDTILLSCGGHGFEMLEPTIMIEVKQGPYAGEADKERFDSVTPERIKIDKL